MDSLNIFNQLTVIFPHRWQWILKENGSSWYTKGNKLSDKKLIELYQREDGVVGVGFGKKTKYIMFDIDKNSPLHPENDETAISQYHAENMNSLSQSGAGIVKVELLLAKIGLTENIKIRSSESRGIHLYYPLKKQMDSYALGKYVTEYLEKNGIEVKNGVLEIFPNKKKGGYSKDKKKWTNYQRHRLPLQPNSGSYLLNDDWSLWEAEKQEKTELNLDSSESNTGDDRLEESNFLGEHAVPELRSDGQKESFNKQENSLNQEKSSVNKTEQSEKELESSEQLREFFARWDTISENQEIKTLKASIYGNKYQKSATRKQIEQELNEQISRGFRGEGETNDILLNLGRRIRIIEQIGGVELRETILQTVKNMPGYEEYCDHQHEIFQRCQDIARWAETKFYLVKEKSNYKNLPKPKTNNQKKARVAFSRILEVLITAFDRPYRSIREFVEKVCKQAKCSTTTLYKYQEYWRERLESQIAKTIEAETKENELDNQLRENEEKKSQKQIVCNSKLDKGLSHVEQGKTDLSKNEVKAKAHNSYSQKKAKKEKQTENDCNTIFSKEQKALSIGKYILRIYMLSLVTLKEKENKKQENKQKSESQELERSTSKKSNNISNDFALETDVENDVNNQTIEIDSVKELELIKEERVEKKISLDTIALSGKQSLIDLEENEKPHELNDRQLGMLCSERSDCNESSNQLVNDIHSETIDIDNSNCQDSLTDSNIDDLDNDGKNEKLDTCQLEFIQWLESRGITATEKLRSLLKKATHERLNQLKLLLTQNAKLDNPIGFLFKAIKENWQPNLKRKSSQSQNNKNSGSQSVSSGAEDKNKKVNKPHWYDEFEQWYYKAIACGYCEDLPIRHLSRNHRNEPIVRVNKIDSVFNYPQTSMYWREAKQDFENNCS